MYSTCKVCGESVGNAEAVGCVSVMIPTFCAVPIFGAVAPIAVSYLVHQGLIGKHSPWLYRINWLMLVLIPVLLLVLPMVFWQLPVLLEGIRDRFRRCPKCRARKWEIGGRGFGL